MKNVPPKNAIGVIKNELSRFIVSWEVAISPATTPRDEKISRQNIK